MLNRVVHIPWLKSRTVASLHVTVLSDNTCIFNMVIVEKKKNELNIKKTLSGKKETATLITALNPSVPVIVSIDGKGILHKKVKLNTDIPLLNQALPNASAKDFYIQQTPINKDEAFASVIRKEQAASILQMFSNRGIFIVKMYLGPFGLTPLLPYLVKNYEQLIVSGYSLTTINNSIETIIKEENNHGPVYYQLGEDSIPAEILIPFATGFAYFLPVSDDDTLQIPSITAAREEFAFKTFFAYAGWGALTFFLSILLLNYMLFSLYRDKVDNLTFLTGQNKELALKLDTLKKELNQKELLMEESGYNEPSKFSYYADRIAITLPNSITLNKSDIQPLKKAMKPRQEVVFTKNNIVVSGNTVNSSHLSNWIKILKSEEWVKEVDVINYIQENTSSPGEFEIEIKIKQ